MTDRVVIQFSTTRWKDGGDGLLARLNTLKWHWRNRYSFLIRWKTNSMFSHADLVLENGNLLGASSMGKGSPCIEGNPDGVAIRPPDYEMFGYRRQMILQTPLADKIYDYALDQRGKPFDNDALKAFLSTKFPGYRDWRDPSQWFCYELIVCAFEKGGYFNGPLHWPKNLVAPHDGLLIHINDSNWINKETFWDPIPGLVLPPWES